MNRLRGWWATFTESMTALGVTGPRALTLAAFLVFALQLASIVQFQALVADSRPVITGIDNDGSNAIDVAGRSYWFLDNGFASYGPVYFRIAQTVAWALPELSAPGDLAPPVARTKTLHFALLLTSTLLFAALCLFMANLLVEEAWLTFLVASLFGRAFLTTDPWREFLLRPHPDYALALACALAAYLTYRWWRSPENALYFRASAWAWGVATSVKFTLSLYMPFVFLPVLILTRFKGAARYLGHMLLAYFVVGFPQNFNIPRALRFLAGQSKVNTAADLATVKEWLWLWSTQLLAPLVLLLALGAIAIWRRRGPVPFTRRQALFATGLALGPFALMIPQHVMVPHAHYPMPLVTTVLTLIAVAVPHRLTVNGRYRWYVLGAVIAALSLVRLVPNAINAQVNEQLACRPEARAVFQKIAAYQAAGKKLYIDPYVPSMDRAVGIVSSWRPGKDLITPEFDVLVFNGNHRAGYFAPDVDKYLSSYNSDTQRTRNFYALFHEKSQVRDPQIGDWDIKAKDACSWEIWERR